MPKIPWWAKTIVGALMFLHGLPGMWDDTKSWGGWIKKSYDILVSGELSFHAIQEIINLDVIILLVGLLIIAASVPWHRIIRKVLVMTGNEVWISEQIARSFLARSEFSKMINPFSALRPAGGLFSRTAFSEPTAQEKIVHDRLLRREFAEFSSQEGVSRITSDGLVEYKQNSLDEFLEKKLDISVDIYLRKKDLG